MLAVGVPLYICASASTPVAAALVLKGISPGAALVFLLAGPATNAATLAVLLRFLGRRVMAVYLLLICAGSLLCGWLVNRIYDYSGLDLAAQIGMAEHASSWIETPAALLLLLLIGRSLLPGSTRSAACSDAAGEDH